MKENKLASYRVLMQKKGKDFAELLNITPQSYYKKEKGLVIFKPNEMQIIRDYIRKYYPEVTVDSIFF